MSDDTKQQPTPADLARELIRLDEGANADVVRFKVWWDSLNYAAVHARTIAEALLAAEARVAEVEKAARQARIALRDARGYGSQGEDEDGFSVSNKIDLSMAEIDAVLAKGKGTP